MLMKERKTKSQPLSKVVDFFQTDAGIFTWLICKRSKIKDFKVSETYKYRTKVKSEPKALCVRLQTNCRWERAFLRKRSGKGADAGLIFQKNKPAQNEFCSGVVRIRGLEPP